MAPTINILRRSTKRREFVVNFFGKEVIVTVTASPSVIGKWITHVVAKDDHRFVGTGVQRSRKHSPADTLQLCVNNKCLIVQLQHCSRIPKRLARFLRSDHITFAGIWNGKDSKRLLARSKALEINKLVDVRKYHYLASVRNRSVSRIVWEGLGHNIAPPAVTTTKSDWGRIRLHRAQVLHATIDAQVSYGLALGSMNRN